MKDLRMEMETGANCFSSVVSWILLFHYGDVTWWPFTYFFFYFWGGIYIQEPRNSVQHVSIAKVSLCDSSLSIHIVWEFTRYGLQEKTELLILSFYSMLVANGKVLWLYSYTLAALPLLAWAVNSLFPVFLHYQRKTCNCSFTAAIIGGKMDFPNFFCSEGRKTGICGFTAALIGSKLYFPAFLHSGRRKAGNCIYAAGTCGENL